MYPLGHISLGYFSGKLLKKITGEEFNIPLIWFFSMLPDIDLLVPFLEHRGPTHSIAAALVIMVPILIYYHRGTPYLASLLSHSLIGDYFTDGGIQLLWPLKTNKMRAPHSLMLTVKMSFNIEILLSIVMIADLYLFYWRKRRKI